MRQSRSKSIDVIKVGALCLVFLVHGLTQTTILSQELNSGYHYMALFFRFVSMTSIPLFLIISGYLSKDKSFNLIYLKKGLPLVFSYLIAVVLTNAYNYFWVGEVVTLRIITESIVDLNRSDYAWFARMYFFLYLMIPYLNQLYDSLSLQLNKLKFLLVLGVVSALPNLINSVTAYHSVNVNLPAYFVQLYPFLYFFIGKCIKEYQPRVKKLSVIGLILLVLGVKMAASYGLFNQSVPYLSYFGSYGSASYMLLASSLFILVYDLKLNWIKHTKMIQFISKNTFDIYLISHIFDKYIYNRIDIQRFQGYELFLLLIVSIMGTLFFSTLYAYIKSSVTLIIRRIQLEKNINFRRSGSSV